MTTTTPTSSVPTSADPAPTTAGGPGCRLAARDARIGYAERTVIDQLSVEIPDRSFTVIIGPNACGKSTLLRAMARLLRPRRSEEHTSELQSRFDLVCR